MFDSTEQWWTALRVVSVPMLAASWLMLVNWLWVLATMRQKRCKVGAATCTPN